jgi:methylmalonyl-CoA mutase C-terminal domain/subunit
VLLTGGGIIPPADMDELEKIGVGRLFGPGSLSSDIVAYIEAWMEKKRGND